MSYWKSKVLPKLKKLVKKKPKDQAAEACKSFSKSKDLTAKEIEENKEVLQPKVLAIYQASDKEAQGLLKDPTESGVSEYTEVVQNLLVELSNAECPGAQTLKDAATKHGPSAMAAPIVFLFSKLTVFVSTEAAPTSNTETTAHQPRELENPTKDEPKTALDVEEPAPDAAPTSAAQETVVHV